MGMHLAVNGYFWNRPFNGSGQYTRRLLAQLATMVSDLRISLIVPLEPGEAAPADVPDGINLVTVPIRTGYLGKLLFEQRGFPRAVRDSGAEIAHVPYWGSPLAAPVPVVVTVHDVTTLLVREYRRKASARLYTSLVSASARGAAHIITDSFYSKLAIRDHLSIPEEQITAIYLAAGSEFSSKSERLLDMAVMRKYDLPDFFTLYLGGYEIHKNVTTLIHAYTYVGPAMGKDYPLLLAGRRPQPGANYPDYEAYIADNGIGDYVRWLGFIDEEDKPALYRQAMTVAFPSKHEGFGLGPLEAMACGTPVVTTNASSIPEVVGDAAFTVDPDDSRDMAGALIATLIQDELRIDMRRKGLEQARQFSWEKTAAETLAVYDQVLRGTP